MLSHVNPQVALFHGVRLAIPELSRCVELGCRYGEEAEERVGEVRGKADEVEVAEGVALRLSAGAEELAGVARSRGREAGMRAGVIGGRLGVLGGPPV